MFIVFVNKSRLAHPHQNT